MDRLIEIHLASSIIIYTHNKENSRLDSQTVENSKETEPGGCRERGVEGEGDGERGARYPEGVGDNKPLCSMGCAREQAVSKEAGGERLQGYRF